MQESKLPYVSVKDFLDREGSDKGTWYGGLYDVLLQPYRQSIRCVIEIGIGTLIPDAPSSMVGWAADWYRPGGSLRAWRDFLPYAEIHGVDVAPDTQFTDDRIHTYLCDSSDSEQVTAVLRFIANRTPELIIDDGLHTLDAQLRTLRNFLPILRNAGLYVVEDVDPGNSSAILTEAENIHPGCHAFVSQAHEQWVAVVFRKPLRQ